MATKVFPGFVIGHPRTSDLRSRVYRARGWPNAGEFVGFVREVGPPARSKGTFHSKSAAANAVIKRWAS